MTSTHRAKASIVVRRRAREGGRRGRHDRRVDTGDGGEPLRIERQATEEHRDALGREGVHRAHQPRELRIDVEVVDRVPELVQHRLGPVLTGHVVAQHAHVVATVHVDAERVLALPRAREQIAAIEHRPRRRGRCPRTWRGSARPGRRRRTTGRDRGPCRSRSGRTRRRSATDARRRPGGRSASARSAVVAVLPCAEPVAGGVVDRVEREEQLVLVELGGGETRARSGRDGRGHGPRRSGGARAHGPGRPRPHPRSWPPPTPGGGARCRRRSAGCRRSALSSTSAPSRTRPVGVERRVDRRLEPHDLLADVGGHLLGQHAVAQHGRAAAPRRRARRRRAALARPRRTPRDRRARRAARDRW